MAKVAEKILDITTDVPFNVDIPNHVDVLIDLPPKKFSGNPRVMALVALSLAGLGVSAFLVRKGLEKAKAIKAAKNTIDGEVKSEDPPNVVVEKTDEE